MFAEAIGPISGRIENGKQLVYRRQPAKHAQLEVFADSDWAGDVTTGMAVTRGPHLLRSSRTLQSSTGLRSQEAEHWFAVRAFV